MTSRLCCIMTNSFHTTTTIGLHRGDPLVLDQDTRRRHLHVIGQTGTGKTTLLLQMIAQDLAAGRGVGIIDPLGSLAGPAIGLIPAHRAHEVVIIDPSDLERPIGFNALESVGVGMPRVVAVKQ